MAHPLQSAYDMYMEKLERLIAEEVKIKNMLNEFASEMEIQIPFPNISENPILSTAKLTIGHDDFVGKSGSDAVGDYLERTHTAAVWDDIVEALTQGGYDWNKQGNAKELRSSLVKNTYKFKYIKQNNAFGLKKWYDDEKLKKQKKALKADKNNESLESSNENLDTTNNSGV